MNCYPCAGNCRQGRTCPALAPRTSLDEFNFPRLFRYFRKCGQGRLRSVWLAFDAAFLPYVPAQKGTK